MEQLTSASCTYVHHILCATLNREHSFEVTWRNWVILRQGESVAGFREIPRHERFEIFSGWAQVSGDHIPGLAAVAAPVLAAAVLTLVSAGRRVSPSGLAGMRLHARTASARMGWVDETTRLRAPHDALPGKGNP